MSRYRVMLLGRNFLMSVDGKTARYGFYATRLVEAEDAALAELKAVQRVKEDEKLKKSALNDGAGPPVIFVQNLTNDEGADDPDERYAFFKEEDAAAEGCLDLDRD